jgi:hypothetical protein
MQWGSGKKHSHLFTANLLSFFCSVLFCVNYIMEDFNIYKSRQTGLGDPTHTSVLQ